MTGKLAILILLIILFSTSGCAEQWVEPVIASSLDFYSPYMSSVPGFPLDVKLEIDGDKPFVFSIRLITNKGGFLQWGEDMKVSSLGKSAEYKGKTIYWTPYEEGNEMAENAKIKVTVLYKEKVGEVASSASINIYKNKDGLFTIRKK